MRVKNIILNLTALCWALAGCTPEAKQEPASDAEFHISKTEVAYNYAKLNVTHNGPENLTWYGFLTKDTRNSALNSFIDKYGELVMSGEEITGIKGTNDRLILLEDLDEDTEYRYIVFGLNTDGTLNEDISMGYIDFTTPKNVYLLTETDEWSFTVRRDDQTQEEVIDVTTTRRGRFGWSYVNKEAIKDWEEEYENGYDLYEGDTFMGNFNAIEMFLLQEISTIQYNVQMLGADIEKVTFLAKDGEDFRIPRLESGEYYLLAYGFDKDAQHTQTYSITEITIAEEAPTPEYESWLGTYKFSGKVEKTDDYDQIQEVDTDYFIRIEAVDNNHMYRVRGWECRPPEGYDWENVVEKDWEEDIMGFEKGGDDYIGFPAYFKNGKLEIRESPITYISFGDGVTYTLGIFGYAYYEEAKAITPVLLEGTPMAVAEPIADGETSTTLVAQKAKYDDGKNKLEWTYHKMGYVAHANYAYHVTINPAMKFPITITKIEDNSNGSQGSTPEPDAVIKTSRSMVSFDSRIAARDFYFCQPGGEVRKVSLPAVKIK